MTKHEYTANQLNDAGFTDEDHDKVRALCSHLNCEPSELSLERNEHYGLTVFSQGNAEYAIGTDAEADKAARESIGQTVWAFNASFILSECNLPSELEDGLRAWQEKECEGCNDDLLRMVNRLAGDSFFTDAIAEDGRGHFMSSYDGEEKEEKIGDTYLYIYRIN